MRLRPTERGLAYLSSLALLAVFSVASRDPLLAAISLAVLAPAALDLTALLLTRRRVTIEVEVAPPQSLWVWERGVVEVRSSARLRPVGLPEWLRVAGVEELDGGFLHRLEAVFKRSGVYRIDELGFALVSRLGLFELRDRVRADAEFRVRPATQFWVQAALRALGFGEGGAAGLGRLAPGALQLPEEYFASREYMPGDNLRLVDWKATARRQTLCVKEFRGLPGQRPVFAFDLRGIGPYTCDAVASASLSLAIGFLAEGVEVWAYDVRDGRLLFFRDPRRLLAYVLERVLSSEVVEKMDFYGLVEPLTLDELRRVLREAFGLDLEAGERRNPPSTGFVYVTALVHATGEVVDAASQAVKSGGPATFVVPAEPWLDVGDRALAEEVRVGFERALKKLRALGARIILYSVGSPTQAPASL